jgi:hypothetical protein
LKESSALQYHSSHVMQQHVMSVFVKCPMSVCATCLCVARTLQPLSSCQRLSRGVIVHLSPFCTDEDVRMRQAVGFVTQQLLERVQRPAFPQQQVLQQHTTLLTMSGRVKQWPLSLSSCLKEVKRPAFPRSKYCDST